MITMIAAVDDGWTMGAGGGLPWPRAEADLRRFRELTDRRPIVMGRRTWSSMYRLRLIGRLPIVVTARPDLLESRHLGGRPAPKSFPSLAQALAAAEWAAVCMGSPDACVIGGAGIFAGAFPHCSTVELTRVAGTFPGDVAFPRSGLVDAEGRLLGCWRPVGAARSGDLEFITYRREGAPDAIPWPPEPVRGRCPCVECASTTRAPAVPRPAPARPSPRPIPVPAPC